MFSRSSLRWLRILPLTLLVILAPAGCQKDSPTDPNPSTDLRLDRVEVDHTVLGANDSTEVRAWVVRSDGAPAVGASVRFGELLGSSSGIFSKSETLTDAAGWASAIFRPTSVDSGEVTLKISVGADVEYVVLLVTGEGVADDGTRIAFTTANNQTGVPADGQSALSVTVRMTRGTLRTPVPSIPVTLTAGDKFTDVDGNGVWTAGTDQLVSLGDRDNDGQWDGEGSTPSSVTTDANGQATFLFRAGSNVGAVYLKATGGGVSSELSITQHSTNLQISLETDVRQMLADGVSQTEVSTSIRDWAGAIVPGVVVKFVAGEPFVDTNADGYYSPGETFTDQNSNGAWDAIGSITSTATTSSGSGQASVIYTAGATAGPVTIRATTTNGYSETRIDLVAVPPTGRLELSSEGENWYADGVSTHVVRLRAHDVNGEPLAGKRVRVVAGERFDDRNANGLFDTGDVLLDDADGNSAWTAMAIAPISVITDSNGEVFVPLMAGSQAGAVWVKATADGQSDEIMVVLRGLPSALSLTLSADTDRIQLQGSGGKDNALFSALCYDALGAAVPAGVEVVFTILSGPGGGEHFEGAVSGAYSARTDASGRATALLVSGAAPGPVEVRATSGATVRTLTVDVVDVSALQVEADRAQLAVQGVGGVEDAVITARASDALGRPVGAGFAIRFEIIDGPNQGERLNNSGWGPLDVVTDASGAAQARLRSGAGAGAVEVRITAGSASARTLSFAVASAVVDAIECFADSTSMSENNESDVTAYVYDASHNPVPDGTLVTFSADEGLITGVDGQGSAMTQNGIARATYQATLGDSNSDGVAEITVSSAGVSCQTVINVPRGPLAVARVALDADMAELGVRGTGAIEQTVLRAKLYDSLGRALRSGVPVTFTITDGPGGGERFVGVVGPAITNTDPSGTAVITLESGTVSGTIVVLASSGSRASSHTAIAVAAGPPAYLSLGADKCNVGACGIVNEENELVILASDVYRNPVRDGTVIYFTADKGFVEGSVGLGSTQTTRGQGGAIWRSTGNACEYVVVTASTSGGSLSTDVTFISADDPYSATFVSPAAPLVSIAADGVAELPLRVEVLDQYGFFTLPAEVDYSTHYGRVSNEEESTDGCAASIAKAIYQSSTLDRDYSYTIPDDGLGAADTVTVSTGFGPVGDQLVVNLRTSAASKDKSELNVEGSVPVDGSMIFQVSVADRYGNPLGGHQLAISVSGGTVTTTAYTDIWGVADGLVFQAPGAPQTVTLTVVDVDPGYSGGLVLSASIGVQ